MSLDILFYESTNFLVKKEKEFVKEVFSLLPFKILFRFKYPKLLLFLICIIFSYFVFTNSVLDQYLWGLGDWSYLGVFFAGILFSFGFTSPFSAGLLIVMKPENIILAALIGGFGSLCGDLIIFKFVKVSFEKEFNKLKKERPFLFVKSKLSRTFSPRIWHYLMFALAGFFFASPFIPDEAAVTLLAGLSSMSVKKIAIISFVCNTLGILFLLAL